MKIIREIILPANLVMGAGAAAQTGQIVRSLGVTKALVCTDKGIVTAGLLDTILPSLEESGLEHAIYDGVTPNPPIKTAEEGLQRYRENGCDGLLAVGGGSPMDAAKAIGLLITNDGQIADYERPAKIPYPLPPLVAIPTTYGTGSEVSVGSVITHTAKKYKMGISSPYLIPHKAILDPLLLLHLPPLLAAATGMDTLTHAIETYIAKDAQPFSEALALHAIRLTAQNLPAAMSTDWNLEATANMLYASTLAGIAFNNAGLGLTHGMAHALGGMFDLPHGLVNAILLPYVMAYNQPACRHKYIDIAQAMGENIAGLSALEASDRAIEAVRDLARLLGLPEQLRELGQIDESQIEYMAECALADGNTQANPRHCPKEQVVRLFKMAW